jgi:hypothetical protein
VSIKKDKDFAYVNISDNAAGTSRELNRNRELIPVSEHYGGIFRIVFGKSMVYFMVYAELSRRSRKNPSKLESSMELASNVAANRTVSRLFTL